MSTPPDTDRPAHTTDNTHADAAENHANPASNADVFERAMQAAHAPRDSATSTAKIVAAALMGVSSVALIVAGALIAGFTGGIIGAVLAVGIIAIGGTAVWMADASHKRETRQRQKAAQQRAERRAADAEPNDEHARTAHS